MFTVQDRVRILSEALPYIQRFSGQLIVIKYGGAAMSDSSLKRAVARDLVLLKHVGMHPIIVHGGGPAISEALAEQGIKSRFYKGRRITDPASMKVVAKTLTAINQDIAQAVEEAGGTPVRYPKDQSGSYIRAGKLQLDEHAPDLGCAGQVTGIHPELSAMARQADVIPVLPPFGVDGQGRLYNVNADMAAAYIAIHLKAEKIIVMTNVVGVLDADGRLLPVMSKSQAAELIHKQVAKDGMLPKLECAFLAVEGGVHNAHIIDGRVENAVLLELLTDEGVGTLVTAE